MPKTWDDLLQEGWKRRHNVATGRVTYVRPSGSIVYQRRSLTVEERLEIGDLLFSGRQKRASTVHSLPHTPMLSQASDPGLPGVSDGYVAADVPADSDGRNEAGHVSVPHPDSDSDGAAGALPPTPSHSNTQETGIHRRALPHDSETKVGHQ